MKNSGVVRLRSGHFLPNIAFYGSARRRFDDLVAET